MKNEVKTRGKIYTPNYLVKNICDMGGYVTGKINKKHVIDNSCGDGAFLCEIVERYINDYLVFSDDKETLKNEIEKFIHGIELNSEKCRSKYYRGTLRNLELCEPVMFSDDIIKIERIVGKYNFINEIDNDVVSSINKELDKLIDEA